MSRFESGEVDIKLSTVFSILGKLGMIDRRTLKFPAPDVRYDSMRMRVVFTGVDGETKVVCAISAEALEDHFGGDHKNPIKAFSAHQSRLEHVARRQYLAEKREADGSVLIKTEDM